MVWGAGFLWEHFDINRENTRQDRPYAPGGSAMNIFKKIGLALKARKALKQIEKEVKTMDGKRWIEREFVLSVIGIGGTLWAAAQGFLPPETAAKASLWIISIFIASRTIVKALEPIAKLTKTDKDDKVVAAVSQALDKFQEAFKVKSGPPPAQ